MAERESDCTVEPAPADGILPENFYTTTHLPTQVRLGGRWVEAEGIEMDVAIVVDAAGMAAKAVPMHEVKEGDWVVVGRGGVRVVPLERPKERDVFGFMEAQVSSERPHGHILSDIARRMRALSDGADKGKVLLSGGPAIIHAGGREALAWLIGEGFIQILFAGNALAAHDMEADLYGTSLGYGLAAGRAVPHGHEHHLRTINRIRAIGSIERAVKSGIIPEPVPTSGAAEGGATLRALVPRARI